MTTPERPSLADTIAHIDAAIAEYKPPTSRSDLDSVCYLQGVTKAVEHRKKRCIPIGTHRMNEWLFGPSPAVEPATFPAPARPYLKPALEAAKPNPPATEPGPGWFGRLLNRLIP